MGVDGISTGMTDPGIEVRGIQTPAPDWAPFAPVEGRGARSVRAEARGPGSQRFGAPTMGEGDSPHPGDIIGDITARGAPWLRS